MADREQVLKALRACSPGDTIWCQMRERGECDFAGAYCMVQLLRDAAEMLEAQAPRVMTFDELRAISGTDATAFIENRKKPYYNEMAFVKVEKVYGEEVSFNGQKSIFGAKRKGYGIEWRAWTGRPSAAQMKAEPWKEATP